MISSSGSKPTSFPAVSDILLWLEAPAKTLTMSASLCYTAT
jgi:hypothetical protein